MDALGRLLIVLGVLIALTGPWWIGGPIELHGWDGRSPFALMAGVILSLIGLLVVKVARGGSKLAHVITSLGAAILGFVFMVPAAYSVACVDRHPLNSACETQSVVNRRGPDPAVQLVSVAGDVPIACAALVWAMMGRRRAPTND